MKADLVLDDCRSALEAVEQAETEQEFRIRWTALVSLLRTVGHVLKEVDRESDTSLRRAVDAAWQAWKLDRDEHRIFWDFIEAERNSILKTYQFGTHPGDVEVAVQNEYEIKEFFLDECLFKPLRDGPFAGEDGRDVAREAIAWWDHQVSIIRDQ